MFTPNIKQTAATLAACTALALPAFAEELHYTADLTADAEVPPVESSATGQADVTVDTEEGTVSWTVETNDLSGEAVAAHIHGPAKKDENASPVIDMSDSIMEGSADITDEQIQTLKDGMYYVNVHTEKNPKGEIRGQLEEGEM